LSWVRKDGQNVWKGRVELKNYIFITPESLAYQPNTDSPEPDLADMHVMGFPPGQTMEEALKDILELNENLEGGRPGQTLRLDFKNENRKFFHLKDYKSKAMMAS
jgi:hypothetical protein